MNGCKFMLSCHGLLGLPGVQEIQAQSLTASFLCRLTDPSQYQSIVDAEWNIIYDKLDKCVKSGAKVVLSRLAIGDLATQVSMMWGFDRFLCCIRF
jgi:hypothetical protein